MDVNWVDIDGASLRSKSKTKGISWMYIDLNEIYKECAM